MRAVAQAAGRIIGADSLEALYDVLCDVCGRVLGSRDLTVLAGDPVGPGLVPVGWRVVGGSDPELAEVVRSGPAVTRRRPMLRVEPPEPGAAFGQATLVAPAGAPGRVSGALAVRARRADHFGPEHLDALEAIATLAGTAIRNLALVDELRYSREAYAHQALHDPLTGLANRARLQERLADALGGAHPGRVAVLVLDLDGFKRVNDLLGHPAGDLLLAQVAERLLSATRGSDTVARLGGDEFAVLLENARSRHNVAAVAERIVAALRAPFDLDGAEAVVGTSVGIALGTDVTPAVRAGGSPAAAGDELLRDADLAMYRAKAAGKGRYLFFEPSMYEEAVARLELEADLRAGLAKGEFRLVYQPIVALPTSAIVGVEALVRWHHPLRGVVPPLAFIPLAEETGLIIPLGRWVLEEACRQAAAWGEHAARPDLAVTVNVSGRQLYQPAFVDDVRHALTVSGLAPQQLVLELTETVMLDRPELARERFGALKALGVRLAIDDFGTGYSALSYLRQFPFDVLKIDKSFIDQIADGGQPAALAGAIAALGDALSMRTVAEGVESAEQAAALGQIGCGLAQGYHFSRPVAPDAITALLAAPAPTPDAGPPPSLKP
jgi:diguanylate cyclase (GGDEF)-like protein